MSSPRPLLSVVCPAYQEELALTPFHRELVAVLDGLEEEYEIEVIYVDDGSRDGTLNVLRAMAAADRRVRYLSLSRNFGHQAALTAGLEHARGDVVVSMDSDLQHPPEVIPELLKRWRMGADVVLTIREEDKTLSWFKRATSRAFYQVMRRLSQTEIRPAAADFRLMSRAALTGLLRLGESHRFLRGMVEWMGFPTAEVHFQARPRVAGSSKYTLRKQLALGLTGMFSFSRLPLRLALYLALPMLLIGLGCGAALALRLLLGESSDAAAWLQLAALNLVGGLVLLAVGIQGEYVGRIYEQVKGRPIYLLKETGNIKTEGVPARSQSESRDQLAA